MSYVYLQHHGIKGQKWGVRRFQNADGSYTAAGKKRRNDDEVGQAKAAYKSAKKDYNKSYDKAYGYSSRHAISQFVGKKQKAESDRRWEEVHKKGQALNEAKEQYKTAKTNANKKAVAEYNKKFNAAERASNQADKKWEDVKEQYKSLGKTRVTRLINAARNKSEAAQKYNKDYELASTMSDKADAKWREASAAYRNTGRSRVERVVNNIKYDPDLKKK